MPDMIITGLAWFLLIGYIVTTIEFQIGNRLVKKLEHLPLPDATAASGLPKVSIIIPARNEQRNIEEALTSVLHLDYPDYELVVLNDRSDDQTGAILERMQQRYPQLRVIHIRELPAGWLGKNHAMFVGAQSAAGEFLLFTDADIVLEPTTLTRAVHYAQTGHFDHLAALPQVDTTSMPLAIFMNTFVVFFALYARPWQAANPRSKNHIGVGAFNLIRKSTYERIGTHQAIALRPDDDMKLGKLVKKHGFRQVAVNGLGMVRVEWYASLGEMIDGLAKNAFAGLNYSLPYTLLGVSAQFLFNIWPLVGAFISHGTIQFIYLIILLLQQFLYFDNARHHRMNQLSGLFSPICTALMIYIILRATVLTLRNQGIYWRGTHYPLAALRANRV